MEGAELSSPSGGPAGRGSGSARAPLAGRRRFLAVLALIALAALGIRVAYVAALKYGEARLGDQIYYNAQANAIADGHGFVDPSSLAEPTAEHPPVTALVLVPASLLRDGGLERAVLAHRLTMVLLGVGVVVVIGLLGRALGGDRVGWIAAGIAAAYPNLWVNDGLIMAETPTALVVAGALLAAVAFRDRPATRRAVLLGAIAGLAALVRAELVLLLPLVVAPVIVGSRAAWGARARWLLAAAGASALVMATWVGPNLARFERPVLFSTNDGLTLCGANTDPVYTGRGTGLWALDCAFRPRPPGDRSVWSAHLRDEAVTYVRDHLDRVPAVVGVRVLRVWNTWDPAQMADYSAHEGRDPEVSWAGFVSFWLLVPLAVAGVVLVARRRGPVWPLVAPFVAVTITAAAVYGLVRFRVPAEVPLVVLAALGIDGIARHRQAARASSPGQSPARRTQISTPVAASGPGASPDQRSS